MSDPGDASVSDSDGGRSDDAGDDTEGHAARGARIVAVVAAVATLLVGLIAWWGPWRNNSDTGTKAISTSTSVPDEGDRIAPLTGMAVSIDKGHLLDRPALIAKVDAASEANPYVGLERADLVIEIQVEGISRYMAIFHSEDVDDIGPIRSARVSDADLLPAFGTPLFAISGYNEGTKAALDEAGGFQLASFDVAPGEYFRTPRKQRPHNLLAKADGLWDLAQSPVVRPTAVFPYREPDVHSSGLPVAGLSARVGSGATFAWDEERRAWSRWAHGVPELDLGGDQIAPTNVIVVETGYVQSSADATSPEAITVGSGDAWVFSDGRAGAGTWSRPSRTDPWELRDPSGNPMTLEPGTAWMVLAVEPPTILSAEQVASLPAPEHP